MRLARTSIRLREDHAPGHRMLTAAAAMAGEAEVATAALKALRRAQPEFSLARIADNIPFKRSSGTPTGSTISKPFAALVWTSLGLRCR